MLTLYHSPLSRSVRVVWLAEELGLDYELRTSELVSPLPKPYAQSAPHGKIPAIRDDDLTMFESGAIVEYLTERYGDGRLAPVPGSADRHAYLQWLHFGEATLFPGLGNIAWHVLFRKNADSIPDAMADYRAWAMGGFDTVEKQIHDRSYLLGRQFTAADIMVGYTLFLAKAFSVLNDSWPATCAYLKRLSDRPAMRTALSV